ncbi:MAG: SCO6745 family protein [Acidimicrobiales bacterium]|jgi:hypothetical protein
MTPEELTADVGANLAVVGPGFYFKPETLARGKELGLGGFQFYVMGRGGVLGDVHADVITSAFGYFAPEMVAKLWDAARQTIDPRLAGREYVGCCQEQGRLSLSEVAGLEAFCQAAETVLDNANSGGMALFAGLRAEPLADDLPARAMQLGASLREYRGSAHLIAVMASGLSPQRAHLIKRPDDYGTFGWKDEPAPVSSAEADAKAAAETHTDRICAPAFASLDDAGTAALQAGAAAISEALS